MQAFNPTLATTWHVLQPPADSTPGFGELHRRGTAAQTGVSSDSYDGYVVLFESRCRRCSGELENYENRISSRRFRSRFYIFSTLFCCVSVIH